MQIYIRLLLLLGLLCISLQSQAQISRPGADSGKAVTISSSIFVTDIDDVDSANQSFIANVYMEFRWHDPRLVKANGSSEKTSFDQIWQPRIQLVNQQKLFATFPETLKVTENGNVIYRQRYWGHFSQPMNLKKFPMDSQQLSIQAVATGYNESEVVFVQSPQEPSGLADTLSQTEWTVLDWSAAPYIFQPTQHVEPLSGFQILVNIDRNTQYYVIKIIAPLLLIVAMSWLVFWTDPAESGVRVSITITSMLTLIAYRFSIGELVPKVSYLTRLDYFILSSTVTVFMVLLLIIVSINLAKSSHSQYVLALEKASRIGFPAMLLALTIASFVFL